VSDNSAATLLFGLLGLLLMATSPRLPATFGT
jgi:hypothetical protein